MLPFRSPSPFSSASASTREKHSAASNLDRSDITHQGTFSRSIKWKKAKRSVASFPVEVYIVPERSI